MTSTTDFSVLLVQTKEAARIMTCTADELRKSALTKIAALIREKNAAIQEANAVDVQKAAAAGCDVGFLDRLALSDKGVEALAVAVEDIAVLPNPLGNVLEERELTNGVHLKKLSVSLGVIAVVFESRPNVTIDAACLSIKSGNCVVLKGGSEAIRTNRVLADIIRTGLKETGLPEHAVLFLDATDREVTAWLLKQNAYVDVVIPRGGYGLVKAVVEQSRIPILYHAEGGARIYIDESADVDMAVTICVNAKVRRPATCNSLDTMVVHEKIAPAFLSKVVAAMKEKGVELVGDEQACVILNEAKNPVGAAQESDWSEEFLRLKASIKIVENVDEAIIFIGKYSKRHTEGILAQNLAVIERFINSIDAAALLVNCSTRLHDGGVFGMGAEMGIATGKLHARGPVGLKELTTYKWVAVGDGQVRE